VRAALFSLVTLLAGTAEQAYKTGVELFQSGNAAAAIEPLTQATRLDPRNAQYWKALGVAYAATSDFARANEPFANACRLDRQLADACYYYGRNLYFMDRFEESLIPLEKALDLPFKRWRVYLAMAQAQEALGRASEARANFAKAIAMEASAAIAEKARPSEAPRHYYGLFLFRQGDLPGARAALEQAVRQHPDSAASQFELGRVLYQMNALEAAAMHLERAVQYNYGAAAHLMLGKTYQRLGRTKDAQQHREAGRAKAQ
jgi:tetratricopeptide (TPR) repeat protein